MDTSIFSLILETDRLARKIYHHYREAEGLSDEAARKMLHWMFHMSETTFDPDVTECSLQLSPEAAAELSAN